MVCKMGVLGLINDSERNSGTKYLQFESTSAGAVDTNVITSLNNNGFTVGNDDDS